MNFLNSLNIIIVRASIFKLHQLNKKLVLKITKKK